MKHEPIHHMIRRAGERYPDNPAISWEDQSVSYGELLARVDQLAAELREAGVERGSMVAILGLMTADVLASILAVLEVGGVFVPFDADFPAVRLEAAIRRIEPRFWLVDPKILESVPLESQLAEDGIEAKVLTLNPAWLSGSLKGVEVPRVESVDLEPDEKCYAYFTSGSTGRPKAIVGRLKGLDHFVTWHLETFGIGPGDRMCQVTSFAFDGFLHEALVPLAIGGTLCVSSSRETLLDGAKLAAWLERDGVHLIHCTPSLFRTMLNQDLTPERLPQLRYALLVGEPLLPSDVERWTQVFGERIPLVNLYGPTETTLTKFVYFVKPEDAQLRTIPIGRPMPGTRALVVSDKGEPCAPGKLGEIYIRTPYRSLGYFEEPELTAEVFIRNPFGQSDDDIVYKTGDLGRVREDGEFEFAGRRDHQVKIRGVRIELSPIQSLLSGHPAVEEAAVIAREDARGSKYLCAYLVLEESLDSNVLRDHLLAELPETAVPAAFVEMEELPRTLSGKLDTRALPDPNEGGKRLGREYVPPRTPTEEKICEIFSSLLGVPKVGIHDNFFELGGHSLLVMQLLARIRSSLVAIPLGQVFQTPTVEELALAVTRIELEQAGESDLEELVDQLGSASDEELEELLQEEGVKG